MICARKISFLTFALAAAVWQTLAQSICFAETQGGAARLPAEYTRGRATGRSLIYLDEFDASGLLRQLSTTSGDPRRDAAPAAAWPGLVPVLLAQLSGSDAA